MKKLSLLFSVFLCLANAASFGQYTILHTFNVTAGEYPSGTLTLSGKTLFGTTLYGGKNDSGCVFSMDTSGNNFKDIYDFGGAGNGAFPFYGSLKLAGKRLYGMTQEGGAHDSGCVYSVDTDGTGFRDLFDFNGPNGAIPFGSVTLEGNKIFGMTYEGGTSHLGVIFTVDTLGHNHSTLYAFGGGASGGNPYGDLTVMKSKMYGMTVAGANGDGNIFVIDTDGAHYTDMYDFNGFQNNLPNNILTLIGNRFFGMTYQGGASGDGDIFEIDTTGANFADILDFAGTGSSPGGAFPISDVEFSNGFLYGTTANGGASDSGTVFKVDTSGGFYTDLYDFTGIANGNAPQGDLVIAGGTLYGTAQSGGSTQAGVVFKINGIATAGINSVKNSVSMKLYPNPSNGQFNLQITNYESGIKNIEVYNILGEKVYSNPFTIHNSQFTIDLSSQPSGIYLYRVMAEDGSLVGEGKLVIQK
jgi:uncharacterized repeat protein (TIGR03803 family)